MPLQMGRCREALVAALAFEGLPSAVGELVPGQMIMPFKYLIAFIARERAFPATDVTTTLVHSKVKADLKLLTALTAPVVLSRSHRCLKCK